MKMKLFFKPSFSQILTHTLLVLLIGLPAMAQKTSQEVESCMKENAPTESTFKTDEDSFQSDSSKSNEVNFEGGNEIETINFFKCRGIKLSGKFNSQGVFSSSDAMEGLSTFALSGKKTFG